MALQRLVELTASRVTSVRSLRVQYRLIRKLGSGSYGRVLLAQSRQGGEFSHQGGGLQILPSRDFSEISQIWWGLRKRRTL